MSSYRDQCDNDPKVGICGLLDLLGRVVKVKVQTNDIAPLTDLYRRCIYRGWEIIAGELQNIS